MRETHPSRKSSIKASNRGRQQGPNVEESDRIIPTKTKNRGMLDRLFEPVLEGIEHIDLLRDELGPSFDEVVQTTGTEDASRDDSQSTEETSNTRHRMEKNGSAKPLGSQKTHRLIRVCESVDDSAYREQPDGGVVSDSTAVGLVTSSVFGRSMERFERKSGIKTKKNGFAWKPDMLDNVFESTNSSVAENEDEYSTRRKPIRVDHRTKADTERKRTVTLRDELAINHSHSRRSTELRLSSTRSMESISWSVRSDRSMLWRPESDPIQRTALNLMSATIIPIQRQVRRFLAMNQLQKRLQALVLIQAYTHRWIVQKRYMKERNAIIILQAHFRKKHAQNNIRHKIKCVIDIQRFLRGCIATMHVYQDIYLITVVQSYVRMKNAQEEAKRLRLMHQQEVALKCALDRIWASIAIQTYARRWIASRQFERDRTSVILVQAEARGFIARRHLAHRQACATKLQSNWRCFVDRMTYKMDQLDIIIVQSICRKRLAKQKLTVLQRERSEQYERCATIIQKHWRSYDCRMMFLFYQFDCKAVMIQSVARGYIQRNRVRKYNAACSIQSFARMVPWRAILKRFCASRKIQAIWRGHLVATAYQEYLAACLAAIRIQTAYRRYMCFIDYKEFLAARQIQKIWRGQVYYKNYKKCVTAMKTIQKLSNSHPYNKEQEKYFAAMKIQTRWRGHVCYEKHKKYIVKKSSKKKKKSKTKKLEWDEDRDGIVLDMSQLSTCSDLSSFSGELHTLHEKLEEDMADISKHMKELRRDKEEISRHMRDILRRDEDLNDHSKKLLRSNKKWSPQKAAEPSEEVWHECLQNL